MPDAIHLELDRLGHIMAEHLLTGLHQAVHQMGAEATDSPGEQMAKQEIGNALAVISHQVVHASS
jgi:hypothetical protein